MFQAFGIVEVVTTCLAAYVFSLLVKQAVNTGHGRKVGPSPGTLGPPGPPGLPGPLGCPVPQDPMDHWDLQDLWILGPPRTS